MKIKPSLDEFRSGSSDDEMSLIKSEMVIKRSPIERVNKTIRIRKTFENKLKEESYLRTTTEGQRISESDIIDEALSLYWQSKK